MNKYGVLAAGVLLSLLATPLLAGDMQGVMMKDGKMMMMVDGKATGPMEKEMATTDGQKVKTDGTIKKADGTTSHMQEGQMMTNEGKMVKAGMGHGMKDGMGMKDKGMGMGKEKMHEGMGDMSGGDKPATTPPEK